MKNGRPEIRWTLPIAELAERFKKVTVTLDGNAAYAELKETQRLPIGFTVERGSHLRVK